MGKNCIVCGKEFPGVRNQTICSSACRKQKKKEYGLEYYNRPGMKEKWREYHQQQFPKTLKGYLSKLRALDGSVKFLRGWDSLNEGEREALKEVRASIAEVTFKLKNDTKN